MNPFDETGDERIILLLHDLTCPKTLSLFIESVVRVIGKVSLLALHDLPEAAVSVHGISD